MSHKKHSASRHWLIERITSIILIPLCIWLIAQLVQAVGSDHVTAAAFLAQPLNALLVAAFIAVGFWHTALGIGVVIEDYVHDTKKQKNWICIVKTVCFVIAAICLAGMAKLALA